MLKVLVKKQLAEVFKGYFYDAKKNRMRSKKAIVGWFIFFIAIMVGLLGGIFTFLAIGMCSGLTQAGVGWLYFLIMGSIGVLLGAFGSVFNSYTGLYLSKDNDLLLSLPIPVRTIIGARLVNVWLMGAMYSVVVLLPAVIVYWIVAGPTPARVICGILLFLIITVFVMILSCILGWVVAKISLRLKHKSITTVLFSLLFMGGYYFCYFKANNLIRDIVQNAETYGSKIRGAAYGLYLFGRVGEGSWFAALVFAAAAAVLFLIVWNILSRSFLSIATATGNTARVQYVEKEIRQRSVFGALVRKEIGRFTSSANYMLNCGLGILFLPVAGILMLIKGREIGEILGRIFGISGGQDLIAVVICAGLCLIASMNNLAAPSVSLEGSSLWIPQSLPVSSKTVLRAKAAAQLVVSGIPMLAAVVLCAVGLPSSPAVKALLIVLPLIFTAFLAVYGTTIGVRMPLLNWTNEIAPIKQGGAVTVTIFSSWGMCVVMGGLYLLFGYRIGTVPYLLIWTAGFALAALLLLRWLDTRGAAAFTAL